MLRPEQELDTSHFLLVAERVTSPVPDTSKSQHNQSSQTFNSTNQEHQTFGEIEPKFPTGFGDLTFEELYTATNRIVGYTLKEKLGMTNPEDVDDCMQSGYLNVWKQLQKQPDVFAGKPKTYIVQSVVLRCKSQRYAHVRHNRKIVYDADVLAYHTIDTPTSSQIDTWIDLEQTITTVGEYVSTLDNPIFVLALYSVITEVKSQDVAMLFHRGVSSLTKAKRHIRSTLAHELPQYGISSDPSYALSLPISSRIKPFSRHRELTVSKLLLSEPLRSF